MAQRKRTATTKDAKEGSDRPPILDISSIVKEAVPVEDEAYFVLDGERYAYAQVSAFSLRDRRRYIAAMERIAKLEALDEPSERDEKEYRVLLVAVARQLAPELSEEVAGRLDDGQLSDIALAFFVWTGEHHPRMAVVQRLGAVGSRMVQMKASTGEKQSLDSNGSTEGTPNGG